MGHGGGGTALGLVNEGEVVEDTLSDTLGEGIAIGGHGEAVTFGGVGEVAAFDEGGWDGGFTDDEEAGVTEAAVFGAGDGEEGLLDLEAEDGVRVVEGVVGFAGVLAMEAGFCGGGKIFDWGDIGFDTVDGGVGGGVEVDTDEEVGVGFSGGGGACGEVNEAVTVTGHGDADTCGEEDGTDAEGDIEGEFFFLAAGGRDSAGVLAAVAGVEDDGMGAAGADVGGGADEGVDEVLGVGVADGPFSSDLIDGCVEPDEGTVDERPTVFAGEFEVGIFSVDGDFFLWGGVEGEAVEIGRAHV